MVQAGKLKVWLLISVKHRLGTLFADFSEYPERHV